MPAAWAFAIFAAFVITASLWWPLRAYALAQVGRPAALAPLACAALAGAVMFSLYFVIGHPGLGDGAYADRLRALAGRNPETYNADEALAVLHDAARRNPRDARPLLYIGRVEASQGRFEPALRALDEALRRDPDALDALFEVGRIQAAQGDSGAALSTFEQVLHREPPSAGRLIEIGKALFAAQEGAMTPQAQRYFQRAAQLAPANPLPWFYQALGAQQAGHVEEARALWHETLARLAPNDPRRAMVLQMLERQP